MLKKLNTLIGNKYTYRGLAITVKEVKFIATLYVVKTDKQTYNFYENEVNSFLLELINYEEKPKKTFIMEHTPNTPNTLSEKSTDLSEILYDTIDKVKKDKNYIGQANAICNIVTQMINIKKLELQLKK